MNPASRESDFPTPLAPVEGANSGADWFRLDSSSSVTSSHRVPRDLALPHVPNYDLLEVLGRGGMGIVFKAQHRALRRFVALKMIREASCSPEAHQRFRAEAEAVARLQHPNIVQVYEVGIHEGRPFLALEYVDGGTLTDWLKESAPTPGQAAAVLEPIARAIHHAHERGLIHRDLKPGNILIQNRLAERNPATAPTATGSPAPSDAPAILTVVPKVTDFGLVKSLNDDQRRTETGVILGTPQYMAPEQAAGQGRPLGPGVDIYALGSILYEMLTGRPPFDGASPAETLLLLGLQEPIPPRRFRPRLSRDLETICLKCLQKEPARRYATAADLADDLARFRRGEPILARPIGSVERATRWARRHPLSASLAITVALLLFLLAVVGPIAALWFSSLAKDAERNRQAAGQDLIQSREENRQGLLRLADVHVSAGLLAAGDRDPTRSMLSFAEAARLAHAAGDGRTEHVNRIRFRNWEGRACLPSSSLGTLPTGMSPRSWKVHPTSRWILVASAERVHVWDLEQQREWPLPDGPGTCAAFNRDGSLLAIGTTHQGVQVCKFPSGEKLAAADYPTPVSSLAFDDQSQWLAIGGSTTRIWDWKNRTWLNAEWKSPSLPRALVFDPARKQAALLTDDHSVRLYRVNDPGPEPYTTVTVRAIPHWWATPLLADQGRALILRHPNGRQIEVRNLADGSIKWRWPAVDDPSSPLIESTEVSPDGKLMLVATTRGIQVVALVNQRVTHPRAEWLEEGHNVVAAAFHPDGARFIIADPDQNVRLWSVAGTPMLHRLATPRPVAALTFLHGGRQFAALQDDGELLIWATPLSPREMVQTIPGQKVPVMAAASANGAYFTAFGSPALGEMLHTTQVFHADGRPAGPMLLPDAAILHAAFAPKQPMLALAVTAAEDSEDRLRSLFDQPKGRTMIQIWNWREGQRPIPSTHTPSEPRALAFSPDGAQLAALCAGGEILILDPATGRIQKQWCYPQPARRMPGAPRTSGSLRFSPDGLAFLTWGLDGTLRGWDLATGAEKFMIHGAEGEFTDVDFSPNGRLFAASHERQRIGIYNVASGRPDGESKVPAVCERALAVRFDSTGDALLSAGRNGTAYHWNRRTGALLCPPLTHPQEIVDAHFLPGSDWLLTAGGDGVVRIWDRHDGRAVTPALTAPRCLNALLIDGGRRLVTGRSDGSLFSHELQEILTPSSLAVSADRESALGRYARAVSGLEFRDRMNLDRLTPDAWRTLLHQCSQDRLLPDRLDRDHRRGWLQTEAQRLQRLGAFPHAESLWSELLTLDPENREARLHRAECAISRAAYDVAIADCSAILFTEPGHIDARFLRATALSSVRRPEEAVAELSIIVAAKPTHHRAWTTRGNLHALSGRWDRAAHDLQQAVNAGEPDSAVWLQLALVHLQRGQWAAWRTHSKNAMVRFEFGSTSERLHLAAMCVFHPNAEIEPPRIVEICKRYSEERKTEARPHALRALALVRAKRPEKALEIVHDLVRLSPGGGTAWDRYVMALANLERRDLEAGMKNYRAAVEWHRQVIAGKLPGHALESPASWRHRLELDLLQREAVSQIACLHLASSR